MFVRDFVEVPRPFEEVVHRLVDDSTWLNAIVHDTLKVANQVGYRGVPEASATDAVTPPAVHCIRGPARIRTDSIIVPVHWATEPHRGLLPVLDGELEIAALSESHALVSLHADFPPYGRDDPAIERVAEAALRTFLDHLAALFKPAT
jgi:hypothetical protein